jgi:(2Fe-2S) ferredoxin
MVLIGMAAPPLTPPSPPATLGTLPSRRFRILVCRGPECGDRRESRGVYDAFRAALAGGFESSCELGWQSCFGRCTQGPNVLVREVVSEAPPPRFALATMPTAGPRGVTALYNHVDAARVTEIVAEHIGRGVVVRRFVEPPATALVAAGREPPTGDRR